MVERIDLSAMSTPDIHGKPSLPRRRGARTLLPSSWLRRSLRVEYEIGGEVRTTTGLYLDDYVEGLVIGANGTYLFISWHRLGTIELVGD